MNSFLVMNLFINNLLCISYLFSPLSLLLIVIFSIFYSILPFFSKISLSHNLSVFLLICSISPFNNNIPALSLMVFSLYSISILSSLLLLVLSNLCLISLFINLITSSKLKVVTILNVKLPLLMSLPSILSLLSLITLFDPFFH